MKVATLTIQAENGVDRSLGCRSECSAGRVRLAMDGKFCWDPVPIEARRGPHLTCPFGWRENGGRVV